MKRISIIIVLVILALIIAALAALPFFLNPIAQKIVEQRVYPVFQNRLKIASVNISLFRWIVELKGIELLQPDGFGPGNMLTAESLQSTFAVVPLLKNRLPLNNIKIIRPSFTLIITRDEKLNTDYIFSAKADSADPGGALETAAPSSPLLAKESVAPAAAAPDNTSTSFTLHTNALVIKDGTFTIYNYKTRSQAPTIVLTEMNIQIKNVSVPNTNNVKTTFTGTALLTSQQHKSPIVCSGDGLLFAKPSVFNAQSTIENIDLSDYYYFFPDTAIKIQDGNAWVTSTINIKDDYLDSTHHVKVKNLSLASKDKTLLGKTFLGMPATGLMKVLEATNGALDFDFQVKGKLNDLKFKMRDTIISEITKSVTRKIGSLAGSALSAPEKIKDYGYKAKDGLNKLFNKFKN